MRHFHQRLVRFEIILVLNECLVVLPTLIYIYIIYILLYVIYIIYIYVIYIIYIIYYIYIYLATESWPEWNLNQRPLNSVQRL